VLEATTAQLYTITPADVDTWAKDFEAGEVISDDLAARLRAEYKDQIPIPPDVRRDLNIPPYVKTMSRQQFMDYSLNKPLKNLQNFRERAWVEQYKETEKVDESSQEIREGFLTPSPIVKGKETAKHENHMLRYYLNPNIYKEESKDFNKRVKELGKYLSEIEDLPQSHIGSYSSLVSYGALSLQGSLDATIEWIKKNLGKRRATVMRLGSGFPLSDLNIKGRPKVKTDTLQDIINDKKTWEEDVFKRQEQIDRIKAKILLLYPVLPK